MIYISSVLFFAHATLGKENPAVSLHNNLSLNNVGVHEKVLRHFVKFRHGWHDNYNKHFQRDSKPWKFRVSHILTCNQTENNYRAFEKIFYFWFDVPWPKLPEDAIAAELPLSAHIHNCQTFANIRTYGPPGEILLAILNKMTRLFQSSLKRQKNLRIAVLQLWRWPSLVC